MSKGFKVYKRVVKKNKKTYSVELPDGTIKRIPVAAFSEWTLEEKQKKNTSIKKKLKGSIKKKENKTLDNNESVLNYQRSKGLWILWSPHGSSFLLQRILSIAAKRHSVHTLHRLKFP